MAQWYIIVTILSMLLAFVYFLSIIETNMQAIIPHSIEGAKRIFLSSDDHEHRKIDEEFLRNFYAQHVVSRVMVLNSIKRFTNFATLYNVLVPEVYCPNLVRVGNVNDGGKWVCNPQNIPSNCSIYSLGIREDISFDKELQSFNNYTCHIYGYDMTAQSDQTLQSYKAINGQIQQRKISENSIPSTLETSLSDLMNENGDKEMEILKMDIEKGEYSSLIPFLDQKTVCQIYLEIHGSAYEMLSLIQRITARNYLLFSYEINGETLTACEYSFIHLGCVEKYEAFVLAPYLAQVNLTDTENLLGPNIPL